MSGWREPRRGVLYQDASQQLQAAIDGQGVGLVRRSLAMQAILETYPRDELLQIDSALAAFVEGEVLAPLGTDAAAFWQGFADLLAAFAPRNRALLAKREALQAQIDVWHSERAGKPLINLGGNRERIAEARIMIEQARLLVLKAAWLIDTKGVFAAMSEISQIKVICPNVAQKVVDMAMQIHGGGGLSQDFPLAAAWTAARSLRLADGPDEVHRGLIAKFELMKYKA